jgi:hypothetical protein
VYSHFFNSVVSLGTRVYHTYEVGDYYLNVDSTIQQVLYNIRIETHIIKVDFRIFCKVLMYHWEQNSTITVWRKRSSNTISGE